MAKKTIVSLVDDLDGGIAEESVTFGLDGVTYEIDLSAKNAFTLRDALAPFVASGHRTGGRARRTAFKAAHPLRAVAAPVDVKAAVKAAKATKTAKKVTAAKVTATKTPVRAAATRTAAVKTAAVKTVAAKTVAAKTAAVKTSAKTPATKAATAKASTSKATSKAATSKAATSKATTSKATSKASTSKATRATAKVPAARKDETGAIRDWARANGYTVSERGRIASAILQAYSKAN